jgi:TonB-like protein
MKFVPNTISLLVVALLAMALSVFAQTPKRQKRGATKSPKTLVKCSHGATGGLLCAPPVTLVANPNSVAAQNTVTVQVSINEARNVVSARAVSGNSKLYESAIENAKRQKFAPKLLSGKPVKVEGVIVHKFENPQ